MNRTELIKVIAKQKNLPFDVVEDLVLATLDAIAEALDSGEPVALRGFGRFVPRLRRAVKRHNPSNGGIIDVPASVTVGFQPSKKLKQHLSRTEAPTGEAPAEAPTDFPLTPA